MYGQYKEDLGRFARTHAQKLIDGKLQKRERKFILPEKYQRKLTGLFLFLFFISPFPYAINIVLDFFSFLLFLRNFDKKKNERCARLRM